MQETAPFTFLHSARRVTFAWDALAKLPALAEEFGCRRAAIVMDAYFAGGAIEAQVREMLASKSPVFHFVPQHEPDLATVEACRAALAAADPDLIVAIGGGSAMDAAKVARMLLANPGPPDKIAGPVGVKMRPHRSLFVCAPTTAGTGSEVSESAVIGATGDYKMIFRSAEMTAQVALLDPALTISCPPRVTATAGYDAITHAVEAYVSRLASVMTDPYALSAMGMLARMLPRAVASPDDRAARADCLIASMQAAIAFNSANLGLAHAFSGAMGALYHTAHGLANALALPYVMAFNADAAGAKEREIARIFGADSAAHGLARIRHAIGLDESLDKHLPTEADRELVAQGAIKSGQVRMNPRAATIDDLRALLEAMRRPTGDGAPVLRV
jgi:alcohol dehydrogenase class IV